MPPGRSARVASCVADGSGRQRRSDGWRVDDIYVSPPQNDSLRRGDTPVPSRATAFGDRDDVGATGETGEPTKRHPKSAPINSVWWNWTAPATGTVEINTHGHLVRHHSGRIHPHSRQTPLTLSIATRRSI